MTNKSTLAERMLARFQRDVRLHEMTVLRDDGLYRHLRLGRPQSSVYYFGIITWPGFLTIYGDMGTLTFSRVPDMFRFFRGYTPEGDLEINPYYWSEKVEGIDGSAYRECYEWDSEKFENAINERLDDWLEDKDFSEEELSDPESEAAQLVEEQREAVQALLECSDNEFEAREALGRFDGDSGILQDFWEVDCTSYKHGYLWLCYAIQWAIMKYDVRQMAIGAVSKIVLLK